MILGLEYFCVVFLRIRWLLNSCIFDMIEFYFIKKDLKCVKCKLGEKEIVGEFEMKVKVCDNLNE